MWNLNINVMASNCMTLTHFLVGMCRWENEKWPIHLTKFGPKIGPIYLPAIKNLPRFWEFHENRPIEKNNDPFIPKFRLEKEGVIHLPEGWKWDPIPWHNIGSNLVIGLVVIFNKVIIVIIGIRRAQHNLGKLCKVLMRNIIKISLWVER